MIDSVTAGSSFLIGAVATFVGLFLGVPMVLGLAARCSVCTRSSRRDSARFTSCSARSSASSTILDCIFRSQSSVWEL